VSGYLGKVQGVYDGFEGESDDKVLERIKGKDGPGALTSKPLDGNALLAMKGLFGDIAVGVFFFFFLFLFFF